MRFWTCVLSLSLCGFGLWGQVLPEPAPNPAASTTPKDPFDRDTPRGAVFGFLEACRQKDFVRAARYLTLRGRREADGPELARELKLVLDRKLRTDLTDLSQLPEGDLTDGLRPDRDRLGTVTADGRPVDLLLERTTNEQGQPIWQFSSSTIAQIPALYDDIGSSTVEQRLPAVLVNTTIWDTALWQWLALLLLALLVAAVSSLLARGVILLLRPVTKRTTSDVDDQLLVVGPPPVRLLLAVIAFRAGMEAIAPALLVRLYLGRLLAALFFFGLAWLVVRLSDFATDRLRSKMTQRQWLASSSVMPLARRTVKVLALIVATLATLSYWGYNTTALLAGLGVGGLAVALAAQKTIENLFGGLAIISDRPVLIGDFCKYGDRSGVVEDIGLRSTRIRTLDRTVVTVPNGQFSSLQIENFSKRDKIWFHPVLNLRRDTTPDQVRYVLIELRRLLYAHPKIDPNPARVRMIGIGSYSLDVEIFCYVMTSNFDEFLEIQEDLLLRFLDVVATAGTSLALPTQASVVGEDRGVDPGRQRAAEERVREMRDRHELPLPQFSPEEIRALTNTLDYPPEGSVLRNGRS